MKRYDFDLVVIGGGSGGIAASQLSGSYGARVALCEEDRVGGTCIMRGCIPKKLLVIGSHFSEEIEDARGFGWTVDHARLDWGALVRAKDVELARLEDHYHRLLSDSGVSLLEGRAKIADPHTVEVAGRRVTTANLLIATGGRPALPPTPGIEHVMTSNEALSLASLPRRVVIVGGGYIGCEMAGLFRAAGAEVTVLIRDESLLRGFDGDVREALTLAYREKGIRVVPNTVVSAIERRADGARALHSASEGSFEADAALYATGRTPNSRGMGLEEISVGIDEGGAIVVDQRSQTTIQGVYALGDCTNRMKFTPAAIAEGRALAEMLFHGGDGLFDDRLVPSAVFSQPPVGTIGCTEARAQGEFGTIDVYCARFPTIRQALLRRDDSVMMKLVVDRASQRVVGLHMVGQDAPEIVQGFALAIRCGATKADFDRTMGIHPTIGEELFSLRVPRPS
jgi:glutathione reductase (NADPH)